MEEFSPLLLLMEHPSGTPHLVYDNSTVYDPRWFFIMEGNVKRKRELLIFYCGLRSDPYMVRITTFTHNLKFRVIEIIQF